MASPKSSPSMVALDALEKAGLPAGFAGWIAPAGAVPEEAGVLLF